MAVNGWQAVLVLLEGLSEVRHLHSAAPVPVKCIEDRLDQEDVRLGVPGSESGERGIVVVRVSGLGCARKSRAQSALCFRLRMLTLRRASPGSRGLLLLDPPIAFLGCKGKVGS